LPRTAACHHAGASLDAVRAAGWRPRGGVIDGQGCIPDGVNTSECPHCGCAHALSSGLPNQGPYFLFTQFTICRGFLGGQLIFEGRGYNGLVIVPAMLGCLGVLLVLALASRVRVVRIWGQHPATPPYRGQNIILKWVFSNPFLGPLTLHGGLNRSQFVVFCMVVALLSLCGAYLAEHARVNNLVGMTGRAFGGVAVGCMALVLLPANRHSVLLPLFGMSFDRSLRFHRFLGTAFFVCSTLHMLLMAVSHVRVYQRGDPVIDADGTRAFEGGVDLGPAVHRMARRMVSWNIGFPHGPPLAGLLAWLAALVMVVTAIFRRDRWELFVCTHLAYLFVFAMVFIHYPTTLVLCAPTVLLCGLDLLLRRRASGMCGGGRIIAACHYQAAGVTQLTIQAPPQLGKLSPGHFVTLHIPMLDKSRLHQECHPFSVSRQAPLALGGSITQGCLLS